MIQGSTSDLFTESSNSSQNTGSESDIETSDGTDIVTSDEFEPEIKITDINSQLAEKMLEDRTYPSPSQEDFQYAIYTKRDFILHAYPERKIKTTYKEIKEYRDGVCARSGFKLDEHQSLLANFINPNTPYTGLLIFHGTGSGKSCAAVAIAEKFKSIVEKYGTKIHVLAPGPLLKQNFLNEIIKCTAETYLKEFQDKTIILSKEDKLKIQKNAINAVNQYYRIMTYRSFYKKVLGEKIRDKVVTKKNTVKSSARKTETGEYERDVSMDRIYSLDNTLLIVDEAHALTDNEYGNAIKKIIENSKQLKIILLTATPMKNLADNIVDLLNYIRPRTSQIERDKIFTSARGNLIEFKSGGREYLRKMCRGYVSYLRGADPLTYAERVDMGEIPPGLDFTKVTRCYMEDFQLKAYTQVIESVSDSFDRRSGAIANFAIPGLVKTGSGSRSEYILEGFHGITGLNQVKYQLKNNHDLLTKKIATTLLAKNNIKDESTLMYLGGNDKTLSGDIFKESNLKTFSTKFYTALGEINQTVWGKKGAGLVFVFSYLVKVGVELFKEVLLQNGYLEYEESSNNYSIKPDTKCYYCGLNYESHQSNTIPSNIPDHTFYPATFLSITGKSDESTEQLPEETIKILNNVFGNIENKDGKFLKIVLGSKIMNEGFTLKNIKEIHILDVHFNLAKVDQAIGRGIRRCVHYDITNEENPFPKVLVYKYVVSLKNGTLSAEEDMYRKAEQKYHLIKEVERILQEEAIDCPLNHNGNIFPEELKKYADCGTVDNPCPAICGYMKCQFKCSDKILNAKYYDPNRQIYRKVEKKDLDYSTYDNTLADEEITYAKEKIKELYRLNHIYVLDDIVKYIIKTYPEDKKDLFDDYYVYSALNDLLPITSNDFNNFKDTLTDKFNRPGYLIYRSKYYIFNPFNENETLPMYYRNNYISAINNEVSLNNYITHTADLSKYTNYKYFDDNEANAGIKSSKGKIIRTYDFDSVYDYYEYRNEFKYVGTLDQGKDQIDEFKIRNARPKYLTKKRESGVPSFKGAVCKTAKDKKTLQDMASVLKLDAKNIQRSDICDLIKDKLFDLEKYSTSADKNKLTYFIIPANHPTISFPLNLEDRIKIILNKIQKETKITINPKIHVNVIKNGKFPDIKYVTYKLEFTKEMDKFKELFEQLGGTKSGDKWIIKVE